ncbi:TonB family protein [Morganella morganii]|uniref:TonB family protein n=1 Tax=Morganella morganii TaxID=582 RepID=UPI001BDAF22B|nr:TonB family protein [Morganella morganii]MBT0402050.1 TonB family protein [Morganella morganii subsp. morganii]
MPIFRWISWPILISLCLHASVAAAIYYNMNKEVEDEPKVLMVEMAAFAPAPAAAVAEPQPEPEPETEPEPEPEPEPLVKPVIEKPVEKKPVEKKPKPKPKKEKKVEKPAVKPVETKAPVSDKPLFSGTPEGQQNVQKAPAGPVGNVASAGQSDVGGGDPKALNRADPVYPARARSLGKEGKVRVRFDVDTDGRIQNIDIIEASPKNMFEREVRNAMRKWRYEKKPKKGMTTTIIFRIDGKTSIQ